MIREKENPKGLLYGRACSVCKKSDNKHLREFGYICKQCLLGKKQKENERRLKKRRKNNLSYNRKIVLNKHKECFFCKKIKNLHVHHLDKNRNNNNVENLMVLCISCHFLLHRQMNEMKKQEALDFKNNYFIYTKLCQSENSFLKRSYPFRLY